jgi:phage tail P2-like protein
MKLQDLSIINLLPPYLAQDLATRQALEGFDQELRKAIAQIPNVLIIPNIDKIIDNLLLDILAWQFHIDFYDSSMAINLKQQLITRSLEWHTRKGTKTAIEELVTATISDAQITEWFEDETGELMPYTFSIETNLAMQEASDIDKLYRAIFAMKNTRSWIEAIVRILNAQANYFVGIGLLAYKHSIIKNTIIPRVAMATSYVGCYPAFKGQFLVEAQ